MALFFRSGILRKNAREVLKFNTVNHFWEFWQSASTLLIYTGSEMSVFVAIDFNVKSLLHRGVGSASHSTFAFRVKWLPRFIVYFELPESAASGRTFLNKFTINFWIFTSVLFFKGCRVQMKVWLHILFLFFGKNYSKLNFLLKNIIKKPCNFIKHRLRFVQNWPFLKLVIIFSTTYLILNWFHTIITTFTLTVPYCILLYPFLEILRLILDHRTASEAQNYKKLSMEHVFKNFNKNAVNRIFFETIIWPNKKN